MRHTPCCWNLTLVYPKRIGNVTLLDMHFYSVTEARAYRGEEYQAIVKERGEPLRVSARKKAYYHDWFEKLEVSK